MMWKFAMNQNQSLGEQIPCWNRRAHTEQLSGVDLESGQKFFKSHEVSEEMHKQFLDSFNQCSQIPTRRFGSAHEVGPSPLPYKSLTIHLCALLMGLELLCPVWPPLHLEAASIFHLAGARVKCRPVGTVFFESYFVLFLSCRQVSASSPSWGGTHYKFIGLGPSHTSVHIIEDGTRKHVSCASRKLQLVTKNNCALLE